jgi:thiol-disulfide isomerase/thioredoxin
MSPLFITQMSTLLIHLSILVIVCSVSTSAWMTSIPRVYNNPWRHQRSHHHKYTHRSISSTTQLSYRDDEHDDEDDSIKIKTKKTSSTSRPPLDFQSRMKRAATQNNRRSGGGSNRRGKTSSSTSWRPPNVKIAVSLEDFSNVIEEGRTKKQVVVVRFYATWCKKCHSIRPSFDKVASSKPHVIFVDVPVTNTNVQLHQGLGVKSVPYAHIYCPEKGLVVEEKISRSRFSEFEQLVDQHSS